MLAAFRSPPGPLGPEVNEDLAGGVQEWGPHAGFFTDSALCAGSV